MKRAARPSRTSTGAFTFAVVFTALALAGTGYLFWVRRTSQSLHEKLHTKAEVIEQPKTPMDIVKQTIAAHPVAVFSKSYCPYCAKAKAALSTLLKPDQFFVMELDQREDGDALQDALKEVTGGRSVPRVFVAGNFIGGGDDTAAKAASGELKELLVSAGVISA